MKKNLCILVLVLVNGYALAHDRDIFPSENRKFYKPVTTVKHNLLSATHTDTATDSPTRGSLLYSDSTPLWDELAISTSIGTTLTKVLGTDGTDSGFRTLANFADDLEVLVDHGGLTGLLDDDHTQYLLADGNRPLTGDWAMGAYDLTGGVDATWSGTLTHAGWTWTGTTVADWSDAEKFIKIPENTESALSIIATATPICYINFKTTTGSEGLIFGSAAVNTAYDFLGTGAATFSGTVQGLYLKSTNLIPTSVVFSGAGGLLSTATNLSYTAGTDTLNATHLVATDVVTGNVTLSTTGFTSSSAIDFKLNGDADDYLSFSTVSDIPTIRFVGSTGKITADGGTINLDNENLTHTGTITTGTPLTITPTSYISEIQTNSADALMVFEADRASSTSDAFRWRNADATELMALQDGGRLDVKSHIVSGGNITGLGHIGTYLEITGTSAPIAKFIFTPASSSSGGAGMAGYQNDGAATSSGHRLGYFILGGAYDAANHVHNSVGITGFATENWSAAAGGAELRLETTPNGSTSRVVRVVIDNAGTTKLGDGTNETQISAAGDLSFAGNATVWNDLQFQISDAKVTPALNLPSWEAFTTNTSEYAFSIDDAVDTSANEIPHSWKQGTAGNAHMHITTKAVPAQEEKAQFTVTFAYADTGEVWVEAPLTAELTIPISTTALTNFYLDLGDLTLTNYLVGAQMRCRVKRVAKSAGGTEYAGDIFITQVGIHFEEDTVGSKTETAK